MTDQTDQNAQHEPGSAEQAPAPAANGAPRPVRPCPYCGRLGENDGVQEQCALCKGWFEPLSRQASQNSMGPWFFHDEVVPFRPGCSYETLRKLIAKQRVTGDTLIRGPGSNQFWVFARHCPGIAHLLGACHNCARQASADAFCCDHCGAAFPTFEDRQKLGLAPVRLLPGQAHPNSVAASAMSPGEDPLPRMQADPDDSNYGPLAPTFASAAVEAATAHAESGTRPADQRSPSEETIDEAPEPVVTTTRRDRKHAQMKSAIGALIVVTVILLIAVIALLLRTPSGGSAAAEPAPSTTEQAAVASQPESQIIPQTVWTERLDRADELIATDGLTQLEAALTILREVQADAPAADQPADLDDRINALAEKIESENLRNFLNKND